MFKPLLDAINEKSVSKDRHDQNRLNNRIDRSIFEVALLTFMLSTVSIVVFNNSESDAVPGSFVDGGVKYNIMTGMDTDEVSVIANGYTGEVTIPNNVMYDSVTYSVTSIGDAAFKWSTATSVVLPDSLIKIGNSAFQCSSIKSMVVPDSVTWIGGHSFQECHSLTEIKLGSGVETIDTCAFYGSENLKEVTIPDSVTTLGSGVFEGCGIENVSIGYGVTTIPSRGFFNTKHLVSILIPDNVTEIGASAFYGSGVEYVAIGEGVTVIKGHAFQECLRLTNVSFGSGLSTIEACAFYNCDALESATIPTVKTLGAQVFGLCDNLTVAHVGKAIEDSSAFSGCTGLTSVSFEPDVTRIGNGAFQNCTNLKNVDLPESLTGIGAHAFQNTGLKVISIPSSVEIIEAVAFYGCPSLKYVTIPNSAVLNDQVFNHCPSLNSLIVLHSGPESSDSVLNKIDRNWGLTKGSFSAITIVVSADLNMTGKAMLNRVSSTSSLSFIEDGGTVQDYGTFNDKYGNTIDKEGYIDGKTFKRISIGWIEEIQYALVSFDGGDGTVSPAIFAVSTGSTIEELPILSRAGYTGIFYYMDGSTKLDFSTDTVINSNMTVYVDWEESSYTISYSNNGGEGSIDPETVTLSDLRNDYRLPFSDAFIPPTGLHFIGWSVGSASALYNAGDTIPASMVTRDITIMAMWGSHGYSVSYVLDGETPDDNLLEKWSVRISKAVPSPTKEGCTFIGWKISGDVGANALYGLSATSITTPIPDDGVIYSTVSKMYFNGLSTSGKSILLTAQWTSLTINKAGANITFIGGVNEASSGHLLTMDTDVKFVVSKLSGYRDLNVNVTINGVAYEPSILSGIYTILKDDIVGSVVINVYASVIILPVVTNYDIVVTYDQSYISLTGMPATGQIKSGDPLNIHIDALQSERKASIKSISVIVKVGGEIVDTFTPDESTPLSGTVKIDSVVGDVDITITHTILSISDPIDSSEFPWLITFVCGLAIISGLFSFILFRGWAVAS